MKNPLTFIGDLIMKLSDGALPQLTAEAKDPWNFILAQQLDHRELKIPVLEPAELVRRAQAAFPDLSATKATAILEELDQMHRKAYELGHQVNSQQQSQLAAYDELSAAFPTLNSANRGRVMIQSLINTR